MRPELLPKDALSWVMSVATIPIPADFVAGGALLLTHGIAVHGIDGIEPGRYFWVDGALEEVVVAPEAEARETSQELCADQPLGGDSAYTVYFFFDWDDTIGAAGARAYRAVLFESGIVLGRLNLAACALGYGASGLTTFDADVSSAFATTWTNIAACAVGVPTYRAKKGGLPGQPTRIEGLARTRTLMAERRNRT